MSKVIKMFYEIKDANTNEILESNMGFDEIAFVSGKGQILPKLEEKILEMALGDEKEISLKSQEAFGDYDEKLIQVLPREQFAGIELEVGGTLIGENEDGSSIQVIIKEINDENVTIDCNSPYAGKDLSIKVKITEYRDADADEELTGVVYMPHSCCCGGHDEDEDDDGCCGGSHHHEHGCCGRHKH